MKNLKLPFKYRLSIIFFCIVILISAFLGIFQYVQMRKVLYERFEHEIKMLRENVVSAVTYADKFYNVVEKNFEPEAKLILEAVRDSAVVVSGEEYDLKAFIQGYKNYNLMIIDNNNRVIAATDERQIGLNYNNFFKYVKYFNTIRKGNSFVADRINISVNTSDVKKTFYLPSIDGKYIYCLEIKMKEYVDQLSGYGFDNFDASIDNKEGTVDRITLYNSNGDSYKNANLEIPSHVNYKYISNFIKATQTNKSMVFNGQFENKEVFYEYIPYKIINANGINRVNIIELIYNDSDLKKHLNNSLQIIFSTVAMGAIVSLMLGAFFAAYLSRPLVRLSEATHKIASGDFSISVGINAKDEIGALSRNFDRMAAEVSSLMEIQKQKELDLQHKNKEINLQNEEINALYEETAAMNEELAAMNQELEEKNDELAVKNDELCDKSNELALINDQLAEKNAALADKNLELERGYLETVAALASAIEAKDQYTGNHSAKVKDYSLAIASELGLSDKEVKELRVGSLLHDIGKIGISEEILNKQARFTDDEYEIMKKHPTIGHDILKNVHLNENSRSIVYEHHERYDGKGYPQGLKGNEINYLARIVCVADAYHAMTSSRPYRKTPLDLVKVIAELKNNKGTQFDPVYVDALISWLDKHGDLVDDVETYGKRIGE